MSRQSGMDTYLVQLVERMREFAQNLPDPNEMLEFDEDNLPDF